jgi:opacity protein-like surface antigen
VLAKPPKAGVPARNWTGTYAGVHLGAGRGQTDLTNPFGPQIFGDDIRPGGAIGGGQIGFNYQNGALIVGLEAEGSWSNIEGSNTCFVGLTPIGGINCRAELGGLAIVAGRLGFAQDRNLFFVKGGGAWARSEYEINLVGVVGPVVATTLDRSGWVVGAGIERAVTASWSLKLEYDYIGFGSETVAFNVDRPINRVPVEQQLHLVKLGANYKFN